MLLKRHAHFSCEEASCSVPGRKLCDACQCDLMTCFPTWMEICNIAIQECIETKCSLCVTLCLLLYFLPPKALHIWWQNKVCLFPSLLLIMISVCECVHVFQMYNVRSDIHYIKSAILTFDLFLFTIHKPTVNAVRLQPPDSLRRRWKKMNCSQTSWSDRMFLTYAVIWGNSWGFQRWVI